MEKIFVQYGVMGAIAVSLGYYILWLQNEHRKEREEWRKAQEKHMDRMDTIANENNRVIREHTNILSELKSLFGSRR
jgi:hypothetical protein